jgi:hypothetical protein
LKNEKFALLQKFYFQMESSKLKRNIWGVHKRVDFNIEMEEGREYLIIEGPAFYAPTPSPLSGQ